METMRGWEARRIVAHLRAPTWKMPMIARHMRARMGQDAASIKLFPGVDDLLRRLADAGVRTAIVTSNAAENVRAILGPRNAALVRHVEGGASVFGKGPKLRKVLRASGIPAAEAISIGDEIRDLHASRASGIAFGAVAWGYTTLDGLRAHHPDTVFETMEEMADRLTGAHRAS
jgi:phosphoglycolate phosphatase